MAKRRKATATPHAADYRDPLAVLLDSIQDLLEEHNPILMMRGGSYIHRVGDFSWARTAAGAEEMELVCQVQGSQGRTYLVHLKRDGLGAFDDAYCTCPYSDSWQSCKHTYAALTRLEQRLSDPSDPLRAQLFQLGQRENWERVLDQIDEFIKSQESQRQVEEHPARRLVWRMAIDHYGDLQIFPYEQKRGKRNNRWTKGRKVSWDRFASEPELWTSQVDEQIAEECLPDDDRMYGYPHYGYSQGPDDLKVIRFLKGHSLVFWKDEPDCRISIEEGHFGLALKATKKGTRIVPAVNGSIFDAKNIWAVERVRHADLIAVDKKESRVFVGQASLELTELIKRITVLNPEIPKKSQEKLLERLGELESLVPIALPDNLVGGRIECERRTFLRLKPEESGGLTAEMRVRPIAEGQYFEPGEGAPNVSAMQEKKRVITERDLSAEREQAKRLAAELGLDKHPRMRNWQWQLPFDDQAVELVAAADDYIEKHDGELAVEWPEGARLSISQEVGPQALRVEIEDRHDWFGLKGNIEIDGEQVPLEKLLAGIRDGNRFIEIAKGKFARIAQAFRARLAALSDVVHAHRGGLEFDISAAPVLDDVVEDKQTIVACQRWQEVVRRLEAATDLNPDPPIALMAELRDYQLAGYRWLRRLAEWGVGGCLADDMGLGKTVQTIAVLLDRIEEGPSLVVAPTSVGFNWVREIQRFAPTLKPHLYCETDRNEFLQALSEGDVVVISYGLLQRDAEKLSGIEWGTLVLDEAQKIKNSQTKTARAVCSLESRWRLALTGTPVENHLGELWSIFRAVCPGLFGSWQRFKERFAEPIERQKDQRRRQALAHVLRPFVLRRTKAEVLDELPSRSEVLLSAELSPAERKRYEEARLGAVAKLAGAVEQDGQDKRFEVLAALTKLRQLACHPGLVDAGWKKSSAKLDLLMDVIEELQEGRHRALIFSQFTQHLALIRQLLDKRQISYRYLDGGTSAKRRREEVDAFQRGEGQVFLISLKAGGTGLNLTAADYVIHMDPWWNPAVEDQATDRAHRIGQTRPVTVYRLVAKDTIEEQILAMHADKRNLVAGVLAGTDQAAKLSTKELVKLIRSGGKDDAATALPDATENERTPTRNRAKAGTGASGSNGSGANRRKKQNQTKPRARKR